MVYLMFISLLGCFAHGLYILGFIFLALSIYLIILDYQSFCDEKKKLS